MTSCCDYKRKWKKEPFDSSKLLKDAKTSFNQDKWGEEQSWRTAAFVTSFQRKRSPKSPIFLPIISDLCCLQQSIRQTEQLILIQGVTRPSFSHFQLSLKLIKIDFSEWKEVLRGELWIKMSRKIFTERSNHHLKVESGQLLLAHPEELKPKSDVLIFQLKRKSTKTIWKIEWAEAE